MSISILYNQNTSNFRYSEKTLYHLSIDKAVSCFCIDTDKRKLFLKVLSSPLITKSEIVFRQEVLKDFCRHPNVADELLSLLTRFSEVYDSLKATQKDRLRINTNNNDSLFAAKNILQSNALSLKRLLLFVKAMYNVLDGTNIHSQGLTQLKNALSVHLVEPAYSEMLQYCSSFEYFQASGTLDIKLNISDNGKFDAFDLIEHCYANTNNFDMKKKGLLKFLKKDEPKYLYSCFIPQPAENIEVLLLKAINEISDVFGNLAEILGKRFLDISKELTFYQIAIKYINMLQSKGICLCYPEIDENKQRTKAFELYDFLLLASQSSSMNVVPNDFVFGETDKGVLLFGNNGSGKTVFLRSIATAQIFAQAGLPIPAKEATLPIYNQIVSLFSGAEKELTIDDNAGRFEQEIRELAYVVDTINKKSLVLLNEVLQTTAYEEGATALYHILDFFCQKGITFICVTHLNQIKSFYSTNDIKCLHTVDGYKVKNLIK